MTELTQGGRRVRSLTTRYGGILFRSALEAKWAMAFDSLGLVWEYEPEAILLSSGSTYLPDFRLPAAAQFVEVKPAGLLKEADALKLVGVCELWRDLASTALRPSIQVAVCWNTGAITGLGCRWNESPRQARNFLNPLVARCNHCGVIALVPYPPENDVDQSIEDWKHDPEQEYTCHLCGVYGYGLAECGDRSLVYYGAHNG